MRTVVLVILCLWGISCKPADFAEGDGTLPTHDLFDQLLKKHVGDDGRVRYGGFVEDKDKLEKYLNLLSTHTPNKSLWGREEQLAYWINAYNAFTIKLIVDHYPVKSIQDLNPTVKIPTVHTVWHREFFQIGGVDFSLDRIEHEILRKEFGEPRIHFAINCASKSCPPLRNEAYIPERIEIQLDSQARLFVNNRKYNRVNADQVEVSQIFSWFKGDFTKDGNLIDYLNRYSNTRINPKAKISYLKYDWSLNE